MKTLDSKINSLKPGQSVTISECNGIKVVAERSGNGKTLRFVRETNTGFVMFKTMDF